MSWVLAASALGAGVLWALQFARDPAVVAPWLALAPLLYLFGRTRASGRLAFLFGFAAWMTGLSWIVPTLLTFGGMSKLVAIPLTGLLAAYLAGFEAIFGWLGGKAWRRWPWLRLLVLPSLWVALEWLRTYLFGGFPWNLAAYSWVEVAGALPLSAWIGPYGISFLVVLASAGVASALERRRWEPLAVAWLVPLLLLPLAGRWSARRNLADVREAVRFGDEGLPVRLIQPNIPNLTAYDPVAVLRNYRKVLDPSVEACQPGTLVIWPESATWPFSYARDPQMRADLDALVKRGCSVLFNSSHPVGESFYNSAYLLTPEGTIHRYDKRHLVPFGEYVPFRGLFSWMDKLARNAGEFRAADGLTLLPWEREQIGTAICYEVVYPAEVAQLTQRGATLLVTITNDAWYGDTWAPWQHLRAARFRAAENRRPLLRAAITGVSAVVGADGSVWTQLGVFKEGVLRARVLGRTGMTPYARLPWLFPLLASLVSGIALVALYSARKEKTS
ncbi:MAG: apolipoprotein N-acyltransferase [Acidobacteriota bacterium]